MEITFANEIDLQEILDLQKLAYQSEAIIYNDFSIQPLVETLDELIDEYKSGTVLKMTKDGVIIGSVRACEKGSTCCIGKLIVHPSHQNKGNGRRLMQEIEKAFSHCKRFELFTGSKSIKNIELYKNLGYKTYKEEKKNKSLNIVFLEKESI